MTATADTSERILASAAELFAERGYTGTATRAIAERAGVNEVTLFRKFKNKRGILEALGKSWVEHMAGFAVQTLPDPSDTRATLRALAEIEVRQTVEMGPAAMRLALDAASTPEVAEVMGGGPGGNFDGLAAYLAQRQAAGDLRADLDARVMAEAFFALTSQVVMSRQVLGSSLGIHYEMPLDSVSAQLLEIYLAGVAPREGE